jgi:hypothetical protein
LLCSWSCDRAKYLNGRNDCSQSIDVLINNSIRVIMDCLTKSAHFIPISTTYRVWQYAGLYVSHIVRYHGIPKAIISDRGSIIVARLSEQLHDCLGTHLIRISTYHPQTDEQTERVNHIIKDMLRACVLTDGQKWDKNLPLAEFSYNSSYQENIKMSPFEALYGWPCRTPLCWSESGKRVIFGPDIVTEAKEKVKQIQANILAAQSHQKSYADKRHNSLELEVDDHVYLWVSQMKDVHHFGTKGKLVPRYIGLYPIIIKYGPTSYQVELPVKLSGVHNVSPMKDVWSLRLMLLSKTPSHWKLIWHTGHIPSRCSTSKTESCATGLLGSIWSSWMIPPNMRPCENMRNFCDPTTPSFFHRGNHPTPLPFYAFTSNLGARFSF